MKYKDDISLEKKYQSEWQNQGLMKLDVKNSDLCSRAYSIANVPGEDNIIKLNIRIAAPPFNRRKNKFKRCSPGICSSYLFKTKPGDVINITGPFGDFFINDSDREMIYVGGGVGMAPLISHLVYLFDHLETKRKVSFWYGARAVQDLYYLDELERISKKHKNFNYNIALSEPGLDDKWKGYTGFIHQVVYENYLKDHEEPEELEYYLCGPPPMVEAVNSMLAELGVEQNMISFDDFG
jgi:Na+-transporting NADH:ubiquinone oxidoreductase subunit F